MIQTDFLDNQRGLTAVTPKRFYFADLQRGWAVDTSKRPVNNGCDFSANNSCEKWIQTGFFEFSKTWHFKEPIKRESSKGGSFRHFKDTL